jgi:phage tail sheath protein FI
MPEYLAPGVYVEEVSFRSRSIEGVSTTTTGFVGATRYGPTEGEPELITSFSQFERIYGGLDPLDFGGTSPLQMPCYLAHGVRAFFDNGGARLYVSRAFTPLSDSNDGRAEAAIPPPVAAIDAADTLARDATNTVLSGLGEAIAAARKAKAAAIAVLRFGANQVLAAGGGIGTTTITYDYGSGSNVETQLTAFIAGLSGPAQTDAQTAFDALRTDATDATTNIITVADSVYTDAQTFLNNAETTQSSLSGAYPSGQAAGSSTAVPTLPPAVLSDPGAGSAGAITSLNTALSDVETAVNNLATPNTDLDTALETLNDVPSASAINDAAQLLVDAAEAVETEAAATAGPISDAATQATLGYRATLEIADATFRARFPGAAGNMAVTITGRLASNVLIDGPNVSQVRDGDLVVIQRGGAALIYSAVRRSGSWGFVQADGSELSLASLTPPANPSDPTSLGDRVYPLVLSVEVQMPGRFAQPMIWEGLTISSQTTRIRDSVTQVFAEEISNRLQQLETPLQIDIGNPDTLQPADLAGAMLGLADWQPKLASSDSDRLTATKIYELADGNDGQRPTAEAFRGDEDSETALKRGLMALEDLEEISIVAAPGYSYALNFSDQDSSNRIQQINQHLITHCETMRYRVAVLDSPNNLALSGVRDYRSLIDNTRAALYYPWVRVLDPVSNSEISLPPSGFLTGIYARNDIQIGVHKAPANEVVRGAIGLETLINKGQQDVLNPLGINCIRFFEGRGIRVWGARTISSDPEWKYLNIRRYFVYLEASIDRATQWAVFEPNGERLWANVRRAVEGFLETEWREGRLAGAALEEAFFVRCDRSTMTQNDIDNGRMICLIGVSPLYPAEFVIFRIGQWTADRR